MKRSDYARASLAIGMLTTVGSLTLIDEGGAEELIARLDKQRDQELWALGLGPRRTPPKPVGERRAKSAARRRRLRGSADA